MDCVLLHDKRGQCALCGAQVVQILLLPQYSCANGFAVQMQTASDARGKYQSTKELDIVHYTMQPI